MFFLLQLTAAFADDTLTKSADGAGHVTIKSNREGTIISVVEAQHTVSTSYGTAVGVSTREICMAPCEFDAPAGLQTFIVSGKGSRGASYKAQIKPGETLDLDARLGSAALGQAGFYTAGLGLLGGLLTGPVIIALTPGNGKGDVQTRELGWILTGAGVVLTGGGIAMMAVSGSKIEGTSRPGAAPSVLDNSADNADAEPVLEVRPWLGVSAAGVSGTF